MPPGDSPSRQALFDALLCGCIPVFFASCVHPAELAGLLSVHDLELVAWYPGLTRRDEARVHRSCHRSTGEFHPLDELDAVLRLCDTLGPRVAVDDADRQLALAWAGRRGRAS